jgi:hypothetical protein
VRSAGWIQPGEAMDAEYLGYIVTEKNHGVALAEQAARHIEAARAALKPADYEQLRHHFQHTLLTARLQRAAASAYFGFRAWSRGGEHRTAEVTAIVQRGLAEMKEVAALIRAYPVKPPVGQWDWVKDADTADRYFNWIVNGAWPKETRGVPNPQAGQKFPFVQP